MVPMKIDGNNTGLIFSEIREDRKSLIFDPLHTHVNNLSGDALALKEVGQSEKSHRQEVNPGKPINRPIIIYQLGNVEEKAAKMSHRGLL